MTEKTEPKQTIELKYPIEVNGVKVNTISLRRAIVQDIEIMQESKGGDTAKSITLIANLSVMAPDDIRALDAGDYMSISNVVQDFFGGAFPEMSGS